MSVKCPRHSVLSRQRRDATVDFRPTGAIHFHIIVFPLQFYNGVLIKLPRAPGIETARNASAHALWEGPADGSTRNEMIYTGRPMLAGQRNVGVYDGLDM
jgi:hypothetical protein